jgi:VWFA-related protein
MVGKFHVLLVLCLCSVGFISDFPGLPLARAQSNNSLKLRVDVDLATVDVVALDKKGNPVRNLKKEDFQLYEDGKQQEILSIDEVNAESPTSSLGAGPIDEGRSRRGKIVSIIFDDGSIRPQDFKKSRDSARKFVSEHMRPQDFFSVATFSISMKILQNFTSDREEVLKAIGQPSNFGAGSMYFEDFLRSLDAIDRSIAPIKGPKSILIYSQSAYSGMDKVAMNNSALNRVSASLDGTYKRTLSSAQKANVKFYVIDPGGTSVSTPAGLSLKSLALENGGSTIGTDIDVELGRLDQQISNYYILGFQSNNPKRDGAFRKVEVKTELKGVALKPQAGYTDRRPIDVLASSRQEKTLLTALATPSAASQLPVNFRPILFYDSPQIARILIATRIRMEKTAFRKKGNQMGTDLNVMGVAYAEDGSTAARFSETLPINFDQEKEPEYRKANIAYRNYFRLRPGKYRLRLAVLDDSDNLGATEQVLEIPPLPDKGFAGSSIIIAEQTTSLPDFIKNLQAQLLDDSALLLYSGAQIEPSVENRVPVNSNIAVMFRVYNPDKPSDQWNLTGKAILRNDKGKEYVLGPASLKNSMSLLGKSEAVVVCDLRFKDAPPGKYQLTIETGEPDSAERVIIHTDIELTSPN